MNENGNNNYLQQETISVPPQQEQQQQQHNGSNRYEHSNASNSRNSPLMPQMDGNIILMMDNYFLCIILYKLYTFNIFH